jgi:hypothetical protein
MNMQNLLRDKNRLRNIFILMLTTVFILLAINLIFKDHFDEIDKKIKAESEIVAGETEKVLVETMQEAVELAFIKYRERKETITVVPTVISGTFDYQIKGQAKNIRVKWKKIGDGTIQIIEIKDIR